MLALPADAIVKLRPGNVFEALQSCYLAFCNVLLVWLAPGLLLACFPGLFLALSRPRVSQAQSKKQARSKPGASQEQARSRRGAGQEQRQKQSHGKPGASQEQARSQAGTPGARQTRQARSKPGARQEQARSEPH